jgi:bifunctional UDP-N-acetylglucosamine pyrophosphorylase / glucosamine-1-phosphate N-acetyltransferase
VVRKNNNSNHIQEIVEHKNASDEQRKIKEINTGAYIFDRKFLEENIGKIEKNELTHEYYLPDMLKIAVSQREPVFAFLVENKYFHGVNTPEELETANKQVLERKRT